MSDSDDGEEGGDVFVAKLLSRRGGGGTGIDQVGNNPSQGPRLVRNQSTGSVTDVDAILDLMNSGENDSNNDCPQWGSDGDEFDGGEDEDEDLMTLYKIVALHGAATAGGGSRRGTMLLPSRSIRSVMDWNKKMTGRKASNLGVAAEEERRATQAENVVPHSPF